MSTTATPTEDGAGYLLNGRKLWTTNGTVADVLVVLAKVPRSEGHKGGITAFIVPSATDGVVVEHRIEFMGLHGIENSQTRYTDAYVPAENVIGREGLGLKIALATLNTGRLALPAICAGVAKWATKVAREFASQRVQWGKPIGEHDEVAQRIAFIAATAFGLEAMLDVASRLADEKRNDVRIEAAIAKLYGSEMGWRVVDELMQVCGGRGYETAAVVAGPRAARRAGRAGHARHARQPHLRGLDRDHAPDHRARSDGSAPARGRGPDGARPPDRDARRRRSAGPAPSTPAGTPGWLSAAARPPSHTPATASWPGRCASSSAPAASSPAPPSTAMARWQAGTEDHGAFLGRIVDIGAELFAMSAAVVYAQTAMRRAPGARGRDPGAGRGVLQPGPAPHRATVPRVVEQRRRGQPPPGARRPQRSAHLAGGRASSTRPPAMARWSPRPKPTEDIPIATVTDGPVHVATAPVLSRLREMREMSWTGVTVDHIGGVVGGGFMGAGIAEVAAVAGMPVVRLRTAGVS